jgi:solute carrier family 35 protein F5
LLLGHMLGFGHFSLLKLFAVVSSLAGVVLICTKDNDMASSTATSNTGARLLGDAFSLLSALLYASYVSLLKVTVKDESKLNTSLFFGFVGAINVVGMWPFGLALHYAGLERLEWPSSREIVAGLILNGFITLFVVAGHRATPDSRAASATTST